MGKKTNNRIIAPIITTVIVSVGCFIHSIEFRSYPTFYYGMVAIVGAVAFAFGSMEDHFNRRYRD